jgi:hypothetical protein
VVVRRFLKENSLSLVFGLLFLLSLVGQAFAGWQSYNDDQLAEGMGRSSLADYVLSANFAVEVSENWQSEYLQFLLFIMATVWLLQKGSTESKPLDQAGPESDEDQKIGKHAEDDSPAWARPLGWRTWLLGNSLALVMGAIFFASWGVQSVAGWASYNETRLEQLRDPITWASYLVHSDFWERTLQNWQSEFLAVGSMAVLSVYLRQRGSSQSKPVGAAHGSTGEEG